MGRNNVDREIAAVAMLNGGAVSSTLLTERGVGGSSIRRRVQSGELRRILKGTYVVAALSSPTSVVHALQLAYPTGAICRYTAAAAHGFAPSAVRQPQFVVPHGTSVAVEGVMLHETRHLPEVDVRVVEGLRATSPARTICDIAPELSERRLVHTLETQLTRNVPDEGSLLACLSERRRRGVAGMRFLSETLGDLIDDQPMPDSVLEMQLLQGLRECGVSGVVRQYRPDWYDGVRGIVDFADPVGRTIIEADGRRFRQVTQAHDNDRQRDRQALANGFVVLRVGYRELQHRRGAVLREIRSLVEMRRQQAHDEAS